MCLILFAHKCVPGKSLVLLMNRDEDYARPTSKLNVREGVLCGLDEKRGGTWIAVDMKSESFRFGAVTNRRKVGFRRRPQPLSRGSIVSNFLASDGQITAKAYLNRIKENHHLYGGVNVLLADETGLWYWTNCVEEGAVCFNPHPVPPGIWGLSNANFDTPWPKVELGKKLLIDCLEKHGSDSVDELMKVMLDPTVPDDSELPVSEDTFEDEKQSASIFLAPTKEFSYGTISTTLISLSSSGHLTVVERTFGDKSSEFTDEVTFTHEFAGLQNLEH